MFSTLLGELHMGHQAWWQPFVGGAALLAVGMVVSWVYHTLLDVFIVGTVLKYISPVCWFRGFKDCGRGDVIGMQSLVGTYIALALLSFFGMEFTDGLITEFLPLGSVIISGAVSAVAFFIMWSLRGSWPSLASAGAYTWTAVPLFIGALGGPLAILGWRRLYHMRIQSMPRDELVQRAGEHIGRAQAEVALTSAIHHDGDVQKGLDVVAEASDAAARKLTEHVRHHVEHKAAQSGGGGSAGSEPEVMA